MRFFSIARLRKQPLGVAAGVLVLAALSFATMASGPRVTWVEANPVITIDTEGLKPGEAQFFGYRDPAGDKIRFLLARDSSGRVHSVCDACQRCYMYGKGYAISHGNLICRACGNRYRLDTMEAGVASCAPVKLPFQMTGQTATIKPADLERERGLFQ